MITGRVSEKTHISTINKKEINLYKELLNDVSVAFNGAKQLKNERSEKICSREDFSVGEVNYFVY